MSISTDGNAIIEEGSTRPWTAHYPICTPAHLEYPDEPVWSVLEHTAHQFPHRLAIRYFHESLSYEALFDQARRAAALFQSLGIQPGDRVGILLPNVPEYLIAAYGIWMAGGVAVSLSPLSVAVELDELLRSTDCRLVVALDLLTPLVTVGEHRPKRVLSVSIAPRLSTVQRILYHAACLKRQGLHLHQPVETRDFVGELSHVEPIAEPVRRDSQSPAYILPTGGTTGHAKSVTLSHANLLANALQLKAWCGNRKGRDTFLGVIPFFHSYGLSTCVTGGVAMAATLVLHHRFQPETVLELIESTRPSVFPAVPAMLHVLNQRLRDAKRVVDVQSLMWVISGGAPLMPETAIEFAKFTGAQVVEGFGLSECSPVTHAGPLDGQAKIGTIGLPLPDTDAIILDAETGSQILEPGEVGELAVRGPQVMLGYWDNPEATAQVFKDGWLLTGDLATEDEDGFFKIVDRKKDLIITSGFNVYPNDVEYVLKQYPHVKDVAVVGVPDKQRGEIVKAIVSVAHVSQFDRHGFEKYIKTNLAHHKVPKVLEFLEGDLPRNFLGKVLRRKLRGEGSLPSDDKADEDVIIEDDPCRSELRLS